MSEFIEDHRRIAFPVDQHGLPGAAGGWPPTGRGDRETDRDQSASGLLPPGTTSVPWGRRMGARILGRTTREFAAAHRSEKIALLVCIASGNMAFV